MEYSVTPHNHNFLTTNRHHCLNFEIIFRILWPHWVYFVLAFASLLVALSPFFLIFHGFFVLIVVKVFAYYANSNYYSCNFDCCGFHDLIIIAMRVFYKDFYYASVDLYFSFFLLYLILLCLILLCLILLCLILLCLIFLYLILLATLIKIMKN